MSQTLEVYRHNKVDILAIDNEACRAEISLHGGQVLGWQPVNQQQVFWMSPTSNYDGKASLRGGIPICWPWFGHIEGRGQHGLVRKKVWQLDKLIEEKQRTTLILSIDLDNTDNPWAYPNRLEQTLVFGKELQQTLKAYNDTELPQIFSYAFHNYFQVSDPANIQIPVLNNIKFYDKINDAENQLENTPVSCTGPIDRIYDCNQSAVFIDSGLKRSITIQKQLSEHWVLWNPGSKASEQMNDIQAGGENNFVCLESAHTTDLIIPPNAFLEVSQTISLQNLTTETS